MTGRKRGICKECNKENILIAKGMCNSCYKRVGTPIITCKICGQLKHHKAFGLCSNCHLKKHHYDTVKKYNIHKYHNIPLELWEEITKECVICGFDKIVDLHHLDRNRKNNSRNNLIGLCPNHHKMLHDQRFKEEMESQIKAKLSKLT